MGGVTTPAEPVHLHGVRPVRDVEYDEVGVVVPEVGAVAGHQGVVRGVALALRPGRLLATLEPLARPPPLGHRHRVGRVGHVDNDPDPVVEARRRRRHVGVAAALPDDAVHAAPATLPVADLLRVEGVFQGVHREPRGPRAARAGRAQREPLLVDQQQTVGDLHLVGVGVRGGVPLPDQLRVRRVGHVQDRGPGTRGAVVGHIEDIALAQHLHAVASTVQIVLGNERQPVRGCGARCRRSHVHVLQCSDRAENANDWWRLRLGGRQRQRPACNRLQSPGLGCPGALPLPRP